MTQKQLDEIKARCKTAVYLLDNIIHADCAYEVYTSLIESAQDIPDLTAEIERLQALTTWIPCSERMPERDDRVLIFCPQMAETEAAIQLTRGYQCTRKRTDVSHWMPLPKPPKEEA